MSFLKNPAWSPYIAGILIGLLQIPAFLLVGTALGASTSYAMVAGHVYEFFGSLDGTYFEKYVGASKYLWQGAMVVSIAIGAFLSMRLSGTVRKSMSAAWEKGLGITCFKKRSVMAFLGGFILLFGARLAGGCTSGHGLSGTAQMAVSSWITVAFMFVGGIIVARVLFKRLM